METKRIRSFKIGVFSENETYKLNNKIVELLNWVEDSSKEALQQNRSLRDIKFSTCTSDSYDEFFSAIVICEYDSVIETFDEDELDDE